MGYATVDPEVVDNVSPTRLIGGPEIGLSEVNEASGETNTEEREEVAAETEIRENVVDESEVREEVAAETEEREEVVAKSKVGENVVDESEVRENVAAGTEVREEVDTETEVREDNVTDFDGAISDLDSSSDSEFDVVPEEDDSDAEEELIAVRNEKRTKLKARRRKKPTVHVEVPLGEGKIDRGFEDISKNKADKYAGKLGGDEDYIDSSDICSDDFDDELDVEDEIGVDLPSRRKSTKLRYDPDCVVAIFELGMIFENVK
ncbi:protein gar2-like [Nicotiana sylvestris]|uniref:protein gar2-like n=1 Tax=Nicotiana sylvestris TaxID=4096 RepID=UPI00388C5134